MIHYRTRDGRPARVSNEGYSQSYRYDSHDSHGICLCFHAAYIVCFQATRKKDNVTSLPTKERYLAFEHCMAHVVSKQWHILYNENDCQDYSDARSDKLPKEGNFRRTTTVSSLQRYHRRTLLARSRGISVQSATNLRTHKDSLWKSLQ